jgi:hypothetical protein
MSDMKEECEVCSVELGLWEDELCDACYQDRYDDWEYYDEKDE